MKKYIAKNDGTTIYDHTVEVRNIVNTICNLLSFSGMEKFKESCLTAAVLHDIGKFTDDFQNEITTGSYATIKHSVISWAFAKSYIDSDSSSSIASTILFHHLRPDNGELTTVNDIIDNLSEDELVAMKNFYDKFKTDVLPLRSVPYESYESYTNEKLYNISNKNIRDESYSNSIQDRECKNLLMRSILVFADRVASDEENKYDHIKIRSNDVPYISSIISSKPLGEFDIDTALNSKYDIDRLKEQIDVVDQSLSYYADNMDHKNTIMIPASAGYGKTLLGLISIIKRNRQTIWCVPTREIAISTFDSIKKELEKMNCPLSVCLYYGHEIKDTYGLDSNSIFDFGITVSVIDSMLSGFHTNNDGHLMFRYLTADMIFDEYHNVVTSNALFAASALLWRSRMWFGDAYSLFLSATALPKEFMSLLFGSCRRMVILKTTIYKGDIRINFHDSPTIPNKSNIFNIFGTVQHAQEHYKEKKEIGADCLLFHGQYDDEDSVQLRKKLFDNFGKNTPESNLSVFTTNIIGTGLDVSAKNIYEYPVSPSDTLQRVCGRASRFGEYDEVDYYIGTPNEKDKRGFDLFVKNIYSSELSEKWIRALKSLDNQTKTKKEFYDFAEKFNAENKEEILNYLCCRLNESRKNLREIGLKSSSKENDETRHTSKQTSLRGIGRDIFIAVSDDEGNTHISTMSIDRVQQIEGENIRSIEYRKYRWNFYKDFCSEKEVNSWKYRYKVKDANTCDLDVCINLAYDEKTPFPIKNMTYSHEFGVCKK